ncbi:pyruvate dehydrogenase protein x component [Metarhizium acridum CQMa 102]|uniref:Pyruvate dehydrogenase protein x component n=2 Tax=Metarhizium acridum TaxID=92637 RepID=E9EFL7_METAQ|nr:pyruvate dehydrogenase protein x component [Metarhizium acridum CQMa 102]EFY85309.1 pyruvate dehydrogenase protein x component [Metarhizium acridum CQMa 102]
MPALSPTMTEGNIATWKVKEGENFSAGDVLLEIETDKATMDVEAQDDGIMMKIMAQDGAKAVQVGTRIAVLAEAGDDIKTLEIPKDEQQQQQQQSSSDSAAAPKQEEAIPENKAKPAPRAPTVESHEQKYPLMPSVEHLVKQNGLSKDDVSKITPTGPGGRLLKGDVLAYLGSINADSPAVVSSRLEKLSHLDLSNIKVAEKKAAPAAPAAAVQEPKPSKQEALPLEINVPVSLSKVVEVQKRIQKTLGVFMPLSTFISRAAEVANGNLPPASRAPTASELFDQVLGLDKIKAAKGSRGVYLPQISAVPPSTLFEPPARSAKKADIIDVLTAKPKKAVREHGIATVPGFSNGLNVFSLVVPREEEHRAHMFLERCKAILEEEPGRLVL